MQEFSYRLLLYYPNLQEPENCVIFGIVVASKSSIAVMATGLDEFGLEDNYLKHVGLVKNSFTVVVNRIENQLKNFIEGDYVLKYLTEGPTNLSFSPLQYIEIPSDLVKVNIKVTGASDTISQVSEIPKNILDVARQLFDIHVRKKTEKKKGNWIHSPLIKSKNWRLSAT